MRPLKYTLRALGVKKAIADRGLPIMLCEPIAPEFPSSVWRWRFWCCHCRVFHYHGADPGSRAAHCISPLSPLKSYLLALDPRYRALDAQCRFERAKLQELKQRLAEREARAIADALPATNSFPKGGAR